MADRYIPEHRRTQFKAKNTFKPEELRRRREEQQVEIRKAKREENLAKRRGIGSDRPGASLGAAPDSDDDTAPTETQVSSSISCPCTCSIASLSSYPVDVREVRFDLGNSSRHRWPLLRLSTGGVTNGTKNPTSRRFPRSSQATSPLDYIPWPISR